jgi:hypothetical protein
MMETAPVARVWGVPSVPEVLNEKVDAGQDEYDPAGILDPLPDHCGR